MGGGRARAQKRSGNEERSRVWRRVKPHKGILWCGRSRIVGTVYLLLP